MEPQERRGGGIWASGKLERGAGKKKSRLARSPRKGGPELICAARTLLKKRQCKGCLQEARELNHKGCWQSHWILEKVGEKETIQGKSKRRNWGF